MGRARRSAGKVILMIALLVGLAVVSSIARQGCDPSPTNRHEVEPPHPVIKLCRVSRVVDGDTAYIDGVRMRLAEIDADEIRTRKGQAAYRWLRDRIEGREVWCFWSRRDCYRRPLVTLWRTKPEAACWETSVNWDMVQAGMAHWYAPPIRRQSGRNQEGRSTLPSLNRAPRGARERSTALPAPLTRFALTQLGELCAGEEGTAPLDRTPSPAPAQLSVLLP